MTRTIDFLNVYIHHLWWVVLLVICVGAVLCILFGLAMEYWRPEPPEPPYRLEFDEFYSAYRDTDNRKE